MPGTRELVSPSFSIKSDESGDDPKVRLRFSVLGSKFGPVEVVLYEYEAAALVEELRDLLGV